MERLTYEQACNLPSGSRVLERFHMNWGDHKVGEAEFKISIRKDGPYLRGDHGGNYKLKPEHFERNEYYLVELGTWRRKKCSE